METSSLNAAVGQNSNFLTFKSALLEVKLPTNGGGKFGGGKMVAENLTN